MKSLVEIESVLLNQELFKSRFCCDLDECKGICCCLAGGKGAPLLDNEVSILKEVYEIIKNDLSIQSRKSIDLNGLYEGSPGEYYISCIDDKDCIFVYKENEIAKCSIERAYSKNQISWKKPISCHLYPIRINDFGGEVLRYSRIPECIPAIRNGESKSVSLIDFLKESLIRKYGSEWYELLRKYKDH